MFLNRAGNSNSVKVFSGRILHKMHYAGCILGTRVGSHFNESICSFTLTLNIQLSLSSGPLQQLITLTDLLLLLKYLLLHSHTKQTGRAWLKYMIILNHDTKWKRPWSARDEFSNSKNVIRTEVNLPAKYSKQSCWKTSYRTPKSCHIWGEIIWHVKLKAKDRISS